MGLSLVSVSGNNGNWTDAAPLVVPAPAGIQDGMLMIAWAQHTAGGTAITPPAGWIEIDDFLNGTNSMHQASWSRMASGESGTYDFAIDFGFGGGGVHIALLGGVNQTTEFDVAYVKATHYVEYTTESEVTPKPITTVTDDAGILVIGYFHYEDGSTTILPSTGYTLIDEHEGDNFGKGNFGEFLGGSNIAGIQTPGVIDTQATTVNTTGLITLAIRPAAVSGVSTIGAAGDFTSIALWSAAIKLLGKLSEDTIGELIDDAVYAWSSIDDLDFNLTELDGFEITLKATTNKHDGDFGTGSRFVQSIDQGIYRPKKLILEDLSISNTHATGNNAHGFIGGVDVKYRRCIANCDSTGTNVRPFEITSGTITSEIISCRAVGGAFGIVCFPSAIVEHNTVIGAGIGFWTNVTQIFSVKNNVAYNCTTDWGGPGSWDSSNDSNNASEDGTHFGANGVTISGDPFEIDGFTPAGGGQLDGTGLNIDLVRDAANRFWADVPSIGAYESNSLSLGGTLYDPATGWEWKAFDGLTIPSDSILFHDSGKHDGLANAATLTDTTKAWVTNEWANFLCRNTSDGSQDTVASNTGTVITLTTGLAGGTDNDFDIDDDYEIVVDLVVDDQIVYETIAPATNVMLTPEDFTDANWVLSLATRPVTNILAPDGTLTAVELDDNSAGAAAMTQTVTVGKSLGTWTATFFVKKDAVGRATRFARASLQFSGNLGSESSSINFDTNTGDYQQQVVNAGSYASVTSFDVNWWKVQITMVSSDGLDDAVALVIFPAAGGHINWVVDITHTGSIEIWGGGAYNCAAPPPFNSANGVLNGGASVSVDVKGRYSLTGIVDGCQELSFNYKLRDLTDSKVSANSLVTVEAVPTQAKLCLPTKSEQAVIIDTCTTDPADFTDFTVPDDCTFIALCITGALQTYTGLTWDFGGTAQAMTLGQHGLEGPGNTADIYYLANPTVGSKTLRIDWNVVPLEATSLTMVYLKDVNTSAPIVGVDVDQATGTTKSLSIIGDPDKDIMIGALYNYLGVAPTLTAGTELLYGSHSGASPCVTDTNSFGVLVDSSGSPFTMSYTGLNGSSCAVGILVSGIA